MKKLSYWMIKSKVTGLVGVEQGVASGGTASYQFYIKK